jgi:hypothetical protein
MPCNDHLEVVQPCTMYSKFFSLYRYKKTAHYPLTLSVIHFFQFFYYPICPTIFDKEKSNRLISIVLETTAKLAGQLGINKQRKHSVLKYSKKTADSSNDYSCSTVCLFYVDKHRIEWVIKHFFVYFLAG